MFAIVSLIVVLILSILITKIAEVILIHTGLSKEVAQFQARSAFTGVGFTTSESETIVNHPVRRRILMTLMLVGNIGIATVAGSFILTFINLSNPKAFLWKLVLLACGLTILLVMAHSRWVNKYLSRVISWALKRYTHLEVRDYASLLNLSGDYRVTELFIEAKDWLVNKTLAQSNLRDEGILILGVKRKDGSYLGAPDGSTALLEGDVLLLYGRITMIEALDQRKKGKKGDYEHKKAIVEQEKVIAIEKEEDPFSPPS